MKQEKLSTAVILLRCRQHFEVVPVVKLAAPHFLFARHIKDGEFVDKAVGIVLVIKFYLGCPKPTKVVSSIGNVDIPPRDASLDFVPDSPCGLIQEDKGIISSSPVNTYKDVPPPKEKAPSERALDHLEVRFPHEREGELFFMGSQVLQIDLALVEDRLV